VIVGAAVIVGAGEVVGYVDGDELGLSDGFAEGVAVGRFVFTT